MPRPRGAARDLQRIAISAGQRYGSLTVLGEAPATHTGKWRVRRARCRCDCGAETVVRLSNLRTGHTTTCGCGRKSANRRTHGKSDSRLYAIWNGMKQRCQNDNTKSFEYYGGRGIRVCEDWQTFEPFLKWAKANGYRKDLTIERVDVDGDYCPDNCTWIPKAEQSANRRPVMRSSRLLTYRGKTQTLTQWAREVGLNPSTLGGRLKWGWPVDRALTKPARERRV